MMYADLPFYLAIGAMGWGLSLATYRLFALYYQWPMGEWHDQRPALPILVGLIALGFGGLYALARGMTEGAAYSGWAMAAFGLALAIFWTAFLRVGSQISLFLAPVAAGLLFIAWNFGTSALEYHTVRSEVRDLRKAIEERIDIRRDGTPLQGGTIIPRKN